MKEVSHTLLCLSQTTEYAHDHSEFLVLCMRLQGHLTIYLRLESGSLKQECRDDYQQEDVLIYILGQVIVQIRHVYLRKGEHQGLNRTPHQN